MNNKPKVTKTFAEEVMAMMVIDPNVEIRISSMYKLGMYISMRSLSPFCSVRREISKCKFLDSEGYEYDKHLMSTLAEMYKELEKRRIAVKELWEDNEDGSEFEGS